MGVRVDGVSTRAEWQRFVHLPWSAHRGHALWAPPLLRDENRFFDPRRNRAFRYSDATLALARRDGDVVGRIMGIVNRRHNEMTGERTARFGCLESSDDARVAEALLGYVEAWAREQGMQRVVGPMGFTDQDPEGFLVEGFEHGPTLATYYNFEYLPLLVEADGYTKQVDYVVYDVPVPRELPKPYEAVLRRVAARRDFRLHEFECRRALRPFVRPILELMSETFVGAYGFVPPDAEEIDDLARQYLPAIDPRFVKVVSKNERPVGFIVGMPHLMEGLRRANGRLLPIGWLHILRAARMTKQLDLLIGGISPTCRGRGVDVLLGAAMMRAAQRAGFERMDSHHELETNSRVRAEMEHIGGRVYKRYRIYGKEL